MAVFICLATMGAMLTSCDKIDEMEGMNDGRAYYSYRAYSDDFKYEEAAGVFNTAIRSSVGLDPIMGGADDKVTKACDECYETLKTKLKGKKGKVRIIKMRHPDGKQKQLKEYKF